MKPDGEERVRKFPHVSQRRRTQRSRSRRWTLRLLDELGIATTALDRPLFLLAIDRAEAHNLSLYDAVYLVLAETLDAGFVTLDEALADAAGEGARPSRRPPSTAEELAPYRTPAARERLAAIGAYLAELRRAPAG